MFHLVLGPIVVIIIHLIGPWKTQMLAATMILGSSVATAFATQYWHVIVSYAIVQGELNFSTDNCCVHCHGCSLDQLLVSKLEKVLVPNEIGE